MTYDQATYWRVRGKTYAKEFRPERYREQEVVVGRQMVFVS